MKITMVDQIKDGMILYEACSPCWHPTEVEILDTTPIKQLNN